MMRRPRLLIADRAARCASTRIALGADVELCAEADDSELAIVAANRHQPDVCLVGREISGDWLQAVRGICSAAPRAAVVVRADVGDVHDLLQAVETGAVGYVPGQLDADRLRSLIAAIVADEAVVRRSMLPELLADLLVGGNGLTTTESEVLRMLSKGHAAAVSTERLADAPDAVCRQIREPSTSSAFLTGLRCSGRTRQIIPSRVRLQQRLGPFGGLLANGSNGEATEWGVASRGRLRPHKHGEDEAEIALEASCGVLIMLESIRRHADDSAGEFVGVQGHVQQAIESLRGVIMQLRMAHSETVFPMALGFVAASPDPLLQEN